MRRPGAGVRRVAGGDCEGQRVGEGGIKASGLVQFLARPFPHWSGVTVELGGWPNWPEPANLDQATEVMREVADLALAEALPFFDTRAAVFLGVHCPATHLVLAPTRKAGTKQLIGTTSRRSPRLLGARSKQPFR